MRGRRVVAGISGGLLLVVVVAVGFGWVSLRRSVTDLGEDSPHLPGLTRDVVVTWSPEAVPALRAQSEQDLARGLGYVHARERLFQMDFLRRTARGELAEIIGSDLVDADRFLRTFGFLQAAEVELAGLHEDTRRYLEAYAEGVNAGIEASRGWLPPEFVALRYEPGPWSPLDSLAISKLQSMSIGLWETDLARLVGQGAAGVERLKEIDDSYPRWAPTISPTPPELGLRPRQEEAPALEDAPPRTDGAAGGWELEALAKMEPLIRRASTSRASNAWAVSGSRTASGRPLLANDMHLELQAPSLWYLAVLQTPGWSAAGLTIPGLPFVLAGRTSEVAWGLAASNVDEVDLYVEEFDPQDQGRYLTAEGPVPFQLRKERIRVKDAPDVEHVVRASRHGPILSDVDERNRKGKPAALALRWTLHDHPRAADAFLQMLRAKDASAFDLALRGIEAPSLSVVFADRAGNIGYRLVGRVPVRPQGIGPWPLEGANAGHDWLGYLPAEEMPHAMNPEGGVLVASNHRPHPWTDGRYFGTQWAQPFRAMRIQEVLSAGTGLTADDLARLQMDLRDLHALRHRGFAAESAAAAGFPKEAEALRAWDGEASAGSKAAALYHAWFGELSRLVGADELAGVQLGVPPGHINRLLDQGGGPWVDDVSTPQVETLPQLSQRAFKAAVEAVQGRTWGELHTTGMNHFLGSSAILDALLSVNVEPFPSGGSWNTVNATSVASKLPHTSNFGATERHIADLGEDTLRFLVAPGQSGNPLSPHYRDLLPLWQEGRLLTSPALAREAGGQGAAPQVSTWTLRAGPGAHAVQQD